MVVCLSKTGLIISSLLGRVETRLQAVTASQMWVQVGRPRTQRIVAFSRETGDMLTNRKDVDPETMTFRSRWDFIVGFDIEKYRDRALESLETKLKEVVVE